jgi:hypothetical protein
MKFYLWRNWSGGRDFGGIQLTAPSFYCHRRAHANLAPPAVIEDRLFLQ